MAEKIGFVGLGIMGKPMARNLLKAGYELTVYDIVGEAVEEVVGDGAAPASSSREVAAATDKIITMLPDSADSERAILGEGGVLEGASAGKTIIDMSSIAPLVSQRIAAECAIKGVEMLDAPVSGGEIGAVQGTLFIMVGGEESVFLRVKPILESMGKSVVRVGEVGAGGFAKLSNQIIVAGVLQAVSEAMVLAKKAGVDIRLVYDAIRGGMAGGRTLDMKIPAFVEGRFEPGFKMDLHIKDIKNALLAGKALGVALPSTGLVHELFSSCSAQGKGQKDHSVIFTLLEQLSGLR
jgi:2-hydroxy-3-oxopropionate reductase